MEVSFLLGNLGKTCNISQRGTTTNKVFHIANAKEAVLAIFRGLDVEYKRLGAVISRGMCRVEMSMSSTLYRTAARIQ